MVGSVVYAAQPVDAGFPVRSWVGTARCTGLAWRDVGHLDSFALVTDSGLGPELGLGLPGSSFVDVAGHSTADVQLAFEEMVREAVAHVGGEAG